MASIFKRPGSPYYFAAYTSADNRRIKKSTKRKDRAKALELCLAWQRLEDSGRNKTLTLAQARRVMGEITERVVGEKLQYHTSAEWLKEWVAGKDGAVSARTLLKYQQITKEFISYLGSKADQTLEAVTPKDVRCFRDALAKAGHSPATVNQAVRKILSAPFTAAVRLGYISMNPCSAVEALKDEEGERDVFTLDQLQALLKAAADVSSDWKGMVLAGFYTGLRLGDLSGLRWESIDLQANVIRHRTGKTGAKVLVPLHPSLTAWLTAQRRGIGKAPVFPSLNGKTGGGRSGLSSQFAAIMKNAGVKGQILRKGTGAGRTVSSLSFHSMRHSFNSAMANAGVTQEIRQRLTGHATKSANNVYTHHEIEGLLEAVAKIPSVH